MYCNRCGLQVAENSAFCPGCGQQIGVSVYNNAGSERAALRQYELNEMVNMINYFSIKGQQYAEYDYVMAELCRLRKQRSIPMLVWGIVLIYLGALGIPFMGAYLEFSNQSQYHVIRWDNIFISYLTGAFIGLFLLIPGVVLLCSFVKSKKQNNEIMSQFVNRYYELSDELYMHYIAYANCPIGPQYTNPSNLDVIYNTMVSGRADTTKEAINVLVEDAHRNRMEDIATQTAKYAAEAAQYAQVTAENTARAAKYSGVSALFSAGTYLKLKW